MFLNEFPVSIDIGYVIAYQRIFNSFFIRFWFKKLYRNYSELCELYKYSRWFQWVLFKLSNIESLQFSFFALLKKKLN